MPNSSQPAVCYSTVGCVLHWLDAAL